MIKRHLMKVLLGVCLTMGMFNAGPADIPAAQVKKDTAPEAQRYAWPMRRRFDHEGGYRPKLEIRPTSVSETRIFDRDQAVR